METAEQETEEQPQWQRVCVRLAVSVVAAVGAVVSYGHLADLAWLAGEAAWWLVPASVDGLIVAATLSAWQAKRAGQPVPGMTKLSLTVGLLVSVGANAGVPFVDANSVPPWLVAAVGAWPAVALALAFEALLRVRKTRRQSAARVPAHAADRQMILPHETLTVWRSLPQAEFPRRERAAPAAERQSDEQQFAASVPECAAGNVGLPRPANDLAASAAHAAEGAAERTSMLPVLAAEGLPRDERAAARELVRAAPDEWTGKALADRFKKSERWGRDQVKAARDELEAARRPRLVAIDE